ncbi:hypothetical protein B0H12DRAFT_1077016 [Mycena haematopus]|nr:hypothetical protein B0H12DRAFT_1077016 [Mycena haematopus]
MTCEVVSSIFHFTPRRAGFVEEHRLVIYESEDLPDLSYTTISYTWRGNDTNADDPSSPSYWKDVLGVFQVKGGEDGDPISLDVLLHVCTLSLRHTSRFLWLDRLCIMQTSKPDKMWQIRKMNGIYKSCAMCCILPGGIRRLVRLEEETSWIHRGWTLKKRCPQARHRPLCMEPCRDRIRTSGGFWPTPVIPGQSAHTELSDLLRSSVSSGVTVKIDSVQIPLDFSIFGSGYAVEALMGALGPNESRPDVSTDLNCQYQYIWRSALLRTSSRPVDMVFSIMGLFGVSLNPASFHPDDRLGATVALARGILQNGGKAYWIGATYALDPCPSLSTFPQFPETSVNGKAYLRASDGSRKEVGRVMSRRIQSDRYFVACPGGSMDDEGYLTLRPRAKQDQAVELTELDEIILSAADGSAWRIHDGAATSRTLPSHSHSAEPVTYLVYLGQETQSTSAAYPPSYDPSSLKGWIVQEHAPNKFHKVTYLNISEMHMQWIDRLPVLEVPIGGPHPVTAVDSNQSAA